MDNQPVANEVFRGYWQFCQFRANIQKLVDEIDEILRHLIHPKMNPTRWYFRHTSSSVVTSQGFRGRGELPFNPFKPL